MREMVYRALVDYAPPILLNNRYIANFIENHAIKKRDYTSRELMTFSVLPTENMRRVYRHILDTYSKGGLQLKQSEYEFFKLLILGYGTMRLFDWPERIKYGLAIPELFIPMLNIALEEELSIKPKYTFSRLYSDIKSQLTTLHYRLMFRDLGFISSVGESWVKTFIEDYLKLGLESEDYTLIRLLNYGITNSKVGLRKVISFYRAIQDYPYDKEKLIEYIVSNNYLSQFNLDNSKSIMYMIRLMEITQNISLVATLLTYIKSDQEMSMVESILKITGDYYSKNTFNRELFHTITKDISISYSILTKNHKIPPRLLALAIDVAKLYGLNEYSRTIRDENDILEELRTQLNRRDIEMVDVIFEFITQKNDVQLELDNMYVINNFNVMQDYVRDYKKAENRHLFRYDNRFLNRENLLYLRLKNPKDWIDDKKEDDYMFYWDAFEQINLGVISELESYNQLFLNRSNISEEQRRKYRENLNNFRGILLTKPTNPQDIQKMKNYLNNMMNVIESVTKRQNSRIREIIDSIDQFWIRIYEIGDFERILRIQEILNNSNSCLRYDGHLEKRLELFGLAADPNSKVLVIESKKFSKPVARVIFRLALLNGELVLSRNNLYYSSAYENLKVPYVEIGDKYLESRAAELNLRFLRQAEPISGNSFGVTFYE
ncbi:MAG: hypothetical protein QW785_01625 [Candidatus Anstonellales archaeon]